MAKITVRKATNDDLKAIYALVYELALYEKEPESLTASLQDYENDFAEGLFESLVAEEDGDILGMVLFYDTYSTWKGKMLYLEDFVVTEKARGRGIGQVLFDAFMDTAREKNARIVKWQVIDWNEPALKFYEKNKAIVEKNWWNCKIFLE